MNRRREGFAGSFLQNRRSLWVLSYLSVCQRTTLIAFEPLKAYFHRCCVETTPTQLGVLSMRQEGWLVAHCLEFALAAKARGTLDNIKAEFCRMLRLQLATCKLEEIDPYTLPPASERYDYIFKRARPQIIFGDESNIP